MAVKMLDSVVLRNVRVNRDVLTVVERIGSNLAVREPQVVSLSFARHLFPSDPQADADAGTRGTTACTPGGKRPAHRAGRPGSSAGVLDSRRLATSRRAVRSGRQSVPGHAGGLAMLSAGWPTGSLAGMQRPSLCGSLICSPRSTGVKNRIPPVWQRPQGRQPYFGNYTTY